MTQKQLINMIKESIMDNITAEKTPIYTIDAKDETNDEGIDDMKYCAQEYTSEDEAIQAAREAAKAYSQDNRVIVFYVMAGEYKLPSGDIYGEPDAIYAVSNSDEQTTIDARTQANYITPEVDEYMGEPTTTPDNLMEMVMESVRKIEKENYDYTSSAVKYFHITDAGKRNGITYEFLSDNAQEIQRHHFNDGFQISVYPVGDGYSIPSDIKIYGDSDDTINWFVKEYIQKGYLESRHLNETLESQDSNEDKVLQLIQANGWSYSDFHNVSNPEGKHGVRYTLYKDTKNAMPIEQLVELLKTQTGDPDGIILSKAQHKYAPEISYPCIIVLDKEDVTPEA